jgi:nitrite reductase/ring-hydroxylating ferredoxin subunit
MSTAHNAATETRVLPSDEVTEGAGVMVTVNELEIGIFRVNGRLVAYENRCAHQGGPVCAGEVLGKVEAVVGDDGSIVEERFSAQTTHLVCPWHGWEYDLETGKCAVDARFGLRRFGVRESDGEIYLEL